MGYLAGRGIADITGEIAECGLLGYGLPGQQAAGLHTRLRARAFALTELADSPDSAHSPTPASRILLIVCDLPLVFSSVTQAVLRRLPPGYTEANVVITATHTHCGPGGYSHHAAYNTNTGGFRPHTFRAIVDGIVEAACRAIADLQPALLRLNHGELHDASVNRSRRAFDRNPGADKAAFPDAIDPATTLLTIERDGVPVGVVNWFAVHNTSMTNRNRLVSADNKGYAGYHWEREVAGADYLAEDAGPPLIAAFAQTNAGDLSPNLNLRPGSGPTEDEFENTRIIGTRQYEAAAKLLAAAENAEVLDTGLDSRLIHVDMADVQVGPRFTGDGCWHRTSHAVPGATAFAGALPDGPTGWRFAHPDLNPVLDTVSRQAVYRFAGRLRDSQAPKTLAAPISLLNRVVPFGQEILPIQLLRIGSLYLLCLPFEVTIVAGLRLRRTVAAAVGTDVEHVLVMGYANAYGHYVTTPEEYDAQMYEGASTLFGRWQLAALLRYASLLATAMRDGRRVDPGTAAPDLSRRRRRQAPRPRPDGPPPNADIGQELSFAWDGRMAVAEFAGVHPAHDPRRGGTYYEVQRREGLYWHRIADDGDWSTRMHWTRVPSQHHTTISTVRIEWRVPPETPRGRYRLVYRGDTGQSVFEAHSQEFDIGAGVDL